MRVSHSCEDRFTGKTILKNSAKSHFWRAERGRREEKSKGDVLVRRHLKYSPSGLIVGPPFNSRVSSSNVHIDLRSTLRRSS